MLIAFAVVADILSGTVAKGFQKQKYQTLFSKASPGIPTSKFVPNVFNTLLDKSHTKYFNEYFDCIRECKQTEFR